MISIYRFDFVLKIFFCKFSASSNSKIKASYASASSTKTPKNSFGCSGAVSNTSTGRDEIFLLFMCVAAFIRHAASYMLFTVTTHTVVLHCLGCCFFFYSCFYSWTRRLKLGYFLNNCLIWFWVVICVMEF